MKLGERLGLRKFERRHLAALSALKSKLEGEAP